VDVEAVDQTVKRNTGHGSVKDLRQVPVVLNSRAQFAPHNKQLERTVRGHRERAASAPLHYALASRFQAAARGRSTAR
jgi:hypothetical protein